MLLEQILFGSFVPPASSMSRVHRIGFDSCLKYTTPRKKIIEKRVTCNNSEKIILGIMKRSKKPMLPVDMEKRTAWTRNHCNIVMATLVKKGMLKRNKISLGNTRSYVYTYPGEKNA